MTLVMRNFVIIILCTAHEIITGKCNWGEAAEADTIGKQQVKRTQSGSSSSRGCNRGAAAQGDAIGEQQLKGMQLGVAAEGDAIREWQLKGTQLGSSR